MGLTLGVILAASQIPQTEWSPSSTHWPSQCLRVSTACGCLSLSRVAGVSAHLQPRLAVGWGGGSANSAPAALRLPGRGSRFHGRFSSKHASWEGSCVCRGETSWSFLRARPHPEEGGWFSLPSRPGPQGAGICQACLEPASYSNCPPRLGLLHPCVTLFVFLWIYHGYPKSFLLKSPTWISAVSTLLFISTIMGLSWSSVYISICSFISLCFISHSSKSGFLELRLLRSSYVVWHPRWTFFSFGRVCRVACCCSEKLWVDASTLASFSWRLSSLVGAWRQAGQCLVPAW